MIHSTPLPGLISAVAPAAVEAVQAETASPGAVWPTAGKSASAPIRKISRASFFIESLVPVGQREACYRDRLSARDRCVVELHVAAAAGRRDRSLHVTGRAARVVDAEVTGGAGRIGARILPSAALRLGAATCGGHPVGG